MNNEPVAIRYDFDGYGYQYRDAGHGSNWMARLPEGELLCTHPAKTLTQTQILKVIGQTYFADGYLNDNLIRIAEALLKEASEK